MLPRTTEEVLTAYLTSLASQNRVSTTLRGLLKECIDQGSLSNIASLLVSDGIGHAKTYCLCRYSVTEAAMDGLRELCSCCATKDARR